MDTIKISVRSKDLIAISLLTPLQGSLKTLSDENYFKLKNEILTDGFSFVVHVYEDASDGVIYILDGHQRYECLNRMKAEGFSIPQIPIVFVDADNLDHAKRKVLAAASQYGTFNQDGANNFIGSIAGLSSDLFNSNFSIPSIDSNMIEFNFDASMVVDVKAHERILPLHGEADKNSESTKVGKYIVCPHCNEIFPKEDALVVSDVDHA